MLNNLKNKIKKINTYLRRIMIEVFNKISIFNLILKNYEKNT